MWEKGKRGKRKSKKKKKVFWVTLEKKKEGKQITGEN